MGVVYHAHYVVYFEIGRTELMRAHGVRYADMEEAGASLAVTRLECRYLAPARYDEEIEIETRLVRASGVRVRFEYVIERVSDGARLAEGWTELGCVGRDGRPRRIPEPFASRLRGLAAAT